MRTIKHIIPAQVVNMGGHIIDQPLPVRGIDQIDPFLLIHHWKTTMPGNENQKDVGVGPHPHRGFSPVTFVFKGDVHHRDSFGNNAIVEAGGTQWMHAGRGITHSERPSKALAEKGGEMEFIQFWVNTPAKHKMETADYLPLSEKDTPFKTVSNTKVYVVAGGLNEVIGKAKIYSPLLLLRGTAEVDDKLSIEIPKHFNCLFYLLNGKATFGSKEINSKEMIWFENDADTVDFEIEKDSTFIILSGEPLNEKVESYGPFVMNSQTEILQALNDAQTGKMGILIEEFD